MCVADISTTRPVGAQPYEAGRAVALARRSTTTRPAGRRAAPGCPREVQASRRRARHRRSSSHLSLGFVLPLRREGKAKVNKRGLTRAKTWRGFCAAAKRLELFRKMAFAQDCCMARTGRWTATARPYRSVLYIPGSKERALDKARGLPADAIIFDLEDAVAPDAKAEARETLARAARRAATASAPRSCGSTR